MATKHSRMSLSKGILEMKFMKRTKVKFEKEIENAESRTMYSKEITNKMITQNSNYIIEPSYALCAGLKEGRLSYRGMNPEIERLLELEQAEKEGEMPREQATDVPDKEMLNFYNKTLITTMKKKFRRKAEKDNDESKGSKIPKMQGSDEE